jgi:hypothetical protein
MVLGQPLDCSLGTSKASAATGAGGNALRGHYNGAPRRMWIKILALLALLALLWSIFRLSMGLRWAKVSRESARREEEGRGRRIVAELPSSDGTLGFFAEDHAGFYWPAGEAGKSALKGARLLLNGGVIASAARPAQGLPDPPALSRSKGEVEVALYGTAGRDHTVPAAPCEGESEIAARVRRAPLRGGSEVPPST